MTELEIQDHILNKKKDILYPKLPKFILQPNELSPMSEGLKESCLHGFNSRLENYKTKQIQVVN